MQSSKQREKMKKQSLQDAVSVVAEKVTDATAECVARVVEQHREGLENDQFIRKLLTFQGGFLADLCAHLHTRNIGALTSNVIYGRTEAGPHPTLDETERRGGSLYSNKGSRHSFARRR